MKDFEYIQFHIRLDAEFCLEMVTNKLDLSLFCSKTKFRPLHFAFNSGVFNQFCCEMNRVINCCNDINSGPYMGKSKHVLSIKIANLSIAVSFNSA